MRIYLAGPCDSENRSMMVQIAKEIRNYGSNIELYCPFELKIKNAWDYPQEEWAQMVFDKDIEAIDNCDIMILISLGRISSAGTNWEQGYAYAKGKKIIVFQITDTLTSLMTYCGCKYFINTTKEELIHELYWTLEKLYDNTLYYYTDECRTVLT
jgi:nucleoside deoxyribosyltransferase